MAGFDPEPTPRLELCQRQLSALTSHPSPQPHGRVLNWNCRSSFIKGDGTIDNMKFQLQAMAFTAVVLRF